MIDAAILQGMNAFSLAHPEVNGMALAVVTYVVMGKSKSSGLPFHY